MSIRFAILGAGRIGQVHARAVDGNDKAVLAAVFDPVEAAAASVAEQYGAEIRDLDAIAAADDIDAVIICTPTDLHAQQIEQFARAGKSLLVDVICGIATGKPAAVMSQGKDEAETEKRLHSAALRGDDLIAIDNCEAPLKGDTLCQILIQPEISIRPLVHHP